MHLWKKYYLGDLGKVITGKTPSSKFPQHFGDDMPFITPSDFGSYSKSASSAERYISKDGAAAHQNKILPENSVLVTCIGSDMGKVVVNKTPCLTNQQINSIIPNREIIDYNFLYYSIINKYDLLRSIASDGTTMPIVNKTDFENIEIEAPSDLPTQTRIASILSALDDKIELNRRTNHTLEQMAQTLFKKYFVTDIDPDNLPEGWQFKTIEEVSTKVGMGPFGANIKVETFVDSGMPIISGQNLNYTILEDKKYNYITISHAEKLKNSIVQKGDVIFTHAGNIGQVSIIPEKSKYEKYILSQRQFYLRPNQEIISGYYIILFFKSKQGQDELLSHSSSTGVPSISQPVSNLRRIKILVPDHETNKEFQKQVESFYNLIAQNNSQIKSLEKLRDTLLPKLMRGEINVN